MYVRVCGSVRAWCVRVYLYLYLQAQFLERRPQHLWQLVIFKRLGTRLGEQMKAVPRLYSVGTIKQHVHYNIKYYLVFSLVNDRDGVH